MWVTDIRGRHLEHPLVLQAKRAQAEEVTRTYYRVRRPRLISVPMTDRLSHNTQVRTCIVHVFKLSIMHGRPHECFQGQTTLGEKHLKFMARRTNDGGEN